MSRKRVKNDVRALEELPLFCDASTKADQAQLADVDSIVDEVMQEVEAHATTTAEPAQMADADDTENPTETVGDDLDAALQSLDEPAPAGPPASAPRERLRHGPTQPPNALHGLWTSAGVVLCVVSVALAVVAALQPVQLVDFLGVLSHVGLSPALVMVFGLTTLGVGSLLGRQSRQTADLAQVQASMHELLGVTDQMEATTRALQAADETRAASAMSGDEFGQVLFALQRNEEKLVNLTKATKTFGKPLVEMTTQVADASSQVAQSQNLIQALRIASENGLNRVEESLRKQEDTLRKQEDLLRKQEDLLRKHGGGQTPAGLEELRHNLDELRSGLQGKLDLAVREVKAGPDAVQRQLQSLGTALEGSLATHTQKLRESLDALSKDLAGKLTELTKGGKEAAANLAPVQNAINELRRDLAQLGSGAVRAAAPSAPMPTTSAAASSALALPTPTTDEPVPPNGLATSIAGERSTKSSAVLGAIAKLKKMRG